MKKIQVLVTPVDDPTVMVEDANGKVFGLDDAALARLLAAWEIAEHVSASIDDQMAVELVEPAPFVRPDPTPAEVEEIEETADRLEQTIGPGAGAEYKRERYAGGADL